MNERKGPWFATAYGQRFWPLDPRADEIDIRTIAASLSKVCRYNGHTKEFYSVAQHSVFVSHAVPPHLALEGLLHDAAEAYCQDIIRPIKYSGKVDGFLEIERAIADCVADHFGLERGFDELPEVKLADNRVTLAEKRDLLVHVDGWNLVTPHGDVDEWPRRIEAVEPLQAQYAFLSRFYILKEERAAINAQKEIA